MRTQVSTLFGLAVLGIACLPTTDVPGDGLPQQVAYTYPGCSESGPNGCPSAGNFQCALFHITEKYDPCQLDVDCVGVYTNDCLGYSDCHPAAVNRAYVDAFSAEVATEILRYCGDGDAGTPCTARGNCALFWDGPFCRHGFCRYEPQGADF